MDDFRQSAAPSPRTSGKDATKMKIPRSLLSFLLAVSVTSLPMTGPAWQPTDKAPPPNAARQPVGRPLTVAQQAAGQLAAKSGVRVEWHEGFGTPALVRGDKLGQRRAFSGGKGLAFKGGQAFEEDAVAVMDNLSRFYQLQDAGKELRLKNSEADRLGFHHVRLEQMYQGLRVFGGDVVVHFNKKGDAYQVNGHFAPTADLDVQPTVAAVDALSVAQKDLAGLNRNSFEVTAAPTLAIYAFESAPALAWQMTLSQTNAPARWRYWVDAKTREVLRRYNEIECISPPTSNGTNTVIHGNILTGEGGTSVSVTGWYEFSNSSYYLYNTNWHWQVYNVASSAWPDVSTYAYRTTANWGASDPAEMSLARNIDLTQKYYQNIHGRNSFDNAGILARANVHEGTSYVNAFWDGAELHFGDGDGTTANPLTVIDVVAHEYTHAVTQHTAGLINAGESGGLNESFSDIFGALVEFWSEPDGQANYPGAVAGTADWLCGEDCWVSQVALRDLRDPRRFGQPSRYKGTYWYNEVHNMDGPQNFMFYLLGEGGSGNNDGISYNLSGIGITNAAQIAFRALTVYCTPSTDYRAARAAWVAAATDLNPAWADNVAAAFSAIGIGPFIVTPYAGCAFSGPVGGPFSPSSQTYTLVNSGAVPMGWTSTISSAPWLAATPVSGTLPAGGSTNVTFTLASAANGMGPGMYSANILFSNSVDGVIATRTVTLLIGQPDFFTQWFDTETNDIAYTTLTFRPNGSGEFYEACRTPAATFPTDPAGGTKVAINPSYQYAAITLTNGAQVSLYGNSASTVYVGQNGYITFNSGDGTWVEGYASHFCAGMPRISAWFHAYNISYNFTWKQLSDRAAVTWTNSVSYNNNGTNPRTNRFQVEMFFDGTIRITLLNIGATNGLIGLSRGLDTPIGFVESDFSKYGTCTPQDALQVQTYGGLASSGYVGGPFSPYSGSFVLTNRGASPVNFTVSSPAPWVNVGFGSTEGNGQTNGTIPAGGTFEVIASIGLAANSLTAGTYSNSMTFSNQASGFTQTRSVVLTVNPIPGKVAVTDTILPASDLALPFGDLGLSLTRTEQITINNTDAAYPLVVSNIKLGGSTVSSYAPPTIYGLDYVKQSLVSFSANTPGTLNYIGGVPFNIYAIEFLNGDYTKLYALNNDNNTFMTIAVPSCAEVTIGACAPPGNHNWAGLAWDPNDGTLYASSMSFVDSSCKLHRINIATGTPTFIANLTAPTNTPAIIDIAINAAGQMYGVDVASDRLIAINKATGAGTYVGSLGINASYYAQGLDFDRVNNALYWAGCAFPGSVGVWGLRVINTTNGVATSLGSFPESPDPNAGLMTDVSEIAVASGGPNGFQLSSLPAFPCSIAPGAATTFNVTYAPVVLGSNIADVLIDSNDSSNSVVRVHLTGRCITPPAYDQWRIVRFGTNVNNPAFAGDTADPDHDGLVNLMEYAFNRNPNVAETNSIVRFAFENISGTNCFTFTYTRRKYPTDAAIAEQVSTDLANWITGLTTTLQVTDDGNGVSETVKSRFTAPISSSSQQFLRLSVTKQ